MVKYRGPTELRANEASRKLIIVLLVFKTTTFCKDKDQRLELHFFLPACLVVSVVWHALYHSVTVVTSITFQVQVKTDYN